MISSGDLGDEFNAARLTPDQVAKFVASGAPDEEPDEVGPIENDLRPTSEADGRRINIKVRFMPWLKLRHALGRSRDRRKWLQFLCAVTSYSPFPWQIRAHLADSGDPEVRTNKLVTAGIRTGKSVFAAAEEAELDTVNPGVDHCLVAPTYDQVREVLLPKWMERVTEMADNGYPLLRRMNWSILRADLHCGGRVFFRSSDKVQNLRGFEFGDVLFDESDYSKNPMDALDTLIGRLSAPKAYVRELCAFTTPYQYAGSTIEHWAEQRLIAAKNADPVARERALRAWWFCRARTLDNPTLPPDFLAGILSYSLSQYLKEIEGYPVIHRSARALACYGDGHAYPGEYDPSRPYDLGIDWGQHRPAYCWFQILGDGRAAIVHEYVPDDVPPERQLSVVRQICNAMRREPEFAAVDREDADQIRAFKKLFPRTIVREAESRPEQDRKASIAAVQRLMEPLDGKPKLLVAQHLRGSDAPERGAHGALTNVQWEWDRLRNSYLDVVAKDGTFDHMFDAIAYWAKLVGVERSKAFIQRPIVRGEIEDLLESLRPNRPGLLR